MIALEVARQILLAAVILIGSATSPAEIHILLAAFSPFAAITPISFVQLLAGKHEDVVAKMFAETEFIRAMCRSGFILRLFLVSSCASPVISKEMRGHASDLPFEAVNKTPAFTNGPR